MHRWLWVMLLMTLSWVAEADWTFVVGDDKDSLYMDVQALRKTRTGYQGWLMTTSRYAMQNWGYQSVKGFYEWDCAGGRSRRLSQTGYSGSMGRGRVVSKDTTPDVWRPIERESLGAGAFNVVCARRR